jgi:CheY-like chemotaxis protein
MEDLLERALGPGVLVQKEVPAGLAPVTADANQLELALLNLAVNARDAMPFGGTLSIVARAATLPDATVSAPVELAPGDYVRVSVVDTGMGMDAATLAKAAEPFFTTKGPGKGTGLGLSMVHGLAAQSGGAISVTSQIGAGTTVALWLPQAAKIHSAETNALPSHEPRDGTGAEEPALTILVVDDDALVSTGTAAMLEDLGHRVIEVSSGPLALDALDGCASKIDVVITDHAMPGMTGLELARRIRETYPRLAIILASGYAEITETPDPGDLPRLAKPFRQAELSAAISSAVGTGRVLRDTAAALQVG